MKKPQLTPAVSQAQFDHLLAALIDVFPSNPLARGRAFHAPHFETLLRNATQKANEAIEISNLKAKATYAATRARSKRNQVNRAKRVSAVQSPVVRSVPNKSARPNSGVQRKGAKPSKSVGAGKNKQLGRSKGNKGTSRRASK